MRCEPALVGLLCAIWAAGCGAARAGLDLGVGSIEIELDRRLFDAELVAILNNSSETELDRLERGDEQALVLRLYRLPVSGSCVPETHLTCAFDYYLAVSEFDEQPRQSVFHLGVVGEIVGVTWQEPSEPDSATLRLEVASFPASALERNPELEKVTKTHTLRVRVDAIERAPSD